MAKRRAATRAAKRAARGSGRVQTLRLPDLQKFTAAASAIGTNVRAAQQIRRERSRADAEFLRTVFSSWPARS